MLEDIYVNWKNVADDGENPHFKYLFDEVNVKDLAFDTEKFNLVFDVMKGIQLKGKEIRNRMTGDLHTYKIL